MPNEPKKPASVGLQALLAQKKKSAAAQGGKFGDAGNLKGFAKKVKPVPLPGKSRGR